MAHFPCLDPVKELFVFCLDHDHVFLLHQLFGTSSTKQEALRPLDAETGNAIGRDFQHPTLHKTPQS